MEGWTLWSLRPIGRLGPTTFPKLSQDLLLFSVCFTQSCAKPSINDPASAPPQPNGYQMHHGDLGQSGEEKLYSDKSAEKTQLGKANRAGEAGWEAKCPGAHLQPISRSPLKTILH